MQAGAIPFHSSWYDNSIPFQLGLPVCTALLAFGKGSYDEVQHQNSAHPPNHQNDLFCAEISTNSPLVAMTAHIHTGAPNTAPLAPRPPVGGWQLGAEADLQLHNHRGSHTSQEHPRRHRTGCPATLAQAAEQEAPGPAPQLAGSAQGLSVCTASTKKDQNLNFIKTKQKKKSSLVNNF